MRFSFLTTTSIVLALSACGAHQSNLERPYDAVINPAGAYAFPTQTNLEDYAHNNTPMTQSDAQALASLARRLAGGTHVRVVDTVPIYNVNQLDNDNRLCEIEYPVDSETTTAWIECWDARQVHVRTAADQAVTAVAGPLPRLGDTLETARQILAGTDAPNNTDGTEFRPTVDGVTLDLHIENYLYKDGSRRISLMGIDKDGGVMSPAVVAAVRAAIVPKDITPLPESVITGDARYVVAQGTMAHTMFYYNSPSLGHVVKSNSYRTSSGWVQGTCPKSSPGTMLVYTTHTGEGVKTIVVASVYINVCEDLGM